jgi:hypothetical protein
MPQNRTAPANPKITTVFGFLGGVYWPEARRQTTTGSPSNMNGMTFSPMGRFFALLLEDDFTSVREDTSEDFEDPTLESA